MTEETRKQWDIIIDALHLFQATGLTREELHRHIETVAVLMDLTTVLADVIDSLLLDIDDLLANCCNDWEGYKNSFVVIYK